MSAGKPYRINGSMRFATGDVHHVDQSISAINSADAVCKLIDLLDISEEIGVQINFKIMREG